MNCNNNNIGLKANTCNDSLRHMEQIALNKAGIDCLGGRMCRAEADIKDRYTKAELDRMLARKMDRCGHDRPGCNGKPNICDYYTKEELDQLLAEIACKCDTYSKEELDDLLDKFACTCDCYSKAEVDELLSNKVNKGPLTWFELPIAEGYEKAGEGPYYAIDYKGFVHLRGSVYKAGANAIAPEEYFAYLPEGFRPPRGVTVTAAVAHTSDKNYSDPASIHIDYNGRIYLQHSRYISNFVGGAVILNGVCYPTDEIQ